MSCAPPGPAASRYAPSMIEPGARAPDFTLTDHFGRSQHLADFRGRKHVVLVFYPLDFTPT